MNIESENEYTPGDPILIKNIVTQLKLQGIFDQFRKECITDVDTKPAYQNLCHRVDGQVSSYLSMIKWESHLSKNQLRENIRKYVNECNFVESGIGRIVDQLVNPRINTVLVPKVEDIVYKYVGKQQDIKTDICDQPEKSYKNDETNHLVFENDDKHDATATKNKEETKINKKSKDKNDKREKESSHKSNSRDIKYSKEEKSKNKQKIDDSRHIHKKKSNTKSEIKKHDKESKSKSKSQETESSSHINKKENSELKKSEEINNPVIDCPLEMSQVSVCLTKIDAPQKQKLVNKSCNDQIAKDKIIKRKNYFTNSYYDVSDLYKPRPSYSLTSRRHRNTCDTDTIK